MSGSEEDKRPKFAQGDKKFPLLNFDKNLTIEKAKFDVNPSTSTPISPPSPPSPVEKIPPPLTTSVTLPIVTTVSGPSTPITAISAIPSQSTPLLTKTTKPKQEDRRNVKRKKLAAMSGTATPSEVFHRNLVDAVSNVEDSDENEQYVYPYSGNNTDTTTKNDTIHRTTSSSLYRPQSLQPPQQEFLLKKASTSFFSDVFRPILLKSKSDSKTTSKEFRPKLRNYIDGKNSPPLYRNRQFYSSYGVGDGGYTTDDEEAQHLLTTTPRRAPQNRHKRQKSACSRFILNMTISLILLGLFVILGVMYIAKPLQDLTVEMGRVLSSDKELIFDLRLHAINSNLWTIHVADADISVFAFSQVVPATTTTMGVDPAEYLGGFYHFDEPLSFKSSFHNKKPVTAISQIRIKSPGADKSGNERWSRIIRYPYGLVVRGVLKYKPLSVLSPYPQSIAICDVVRVDPNTGQVSEDPDQAFCLQNHTVI